MSVPTLLTNLLPHLKSMEHSIISMIVELTARLASLTEADIFVLVQNTEQRLFSGNQSLIDLYLNGKLLPRGDDVEMEVPPSSSVTLKRRHDIKKFHHGDKDEERTSPPIAGNSATSITPNSTPNDSLPTTATACQGRLTPESSRPLSLDDDFPVKRLKLTPTEPSASLHRSSPSFLAGIKVDSLSAAEEVDLTADDENDDDNDPLEEVNYFAEDYFAYQQQQLQQFGSPSAPLNLPFHFPANPHHLISPFASPTRNSHNHHIPSHPPPLRPLHHHSLSKTTHLSSPSKNGASNALLVNFDELSLPTQKMNFLKSVPVGDVEKLFLKGTAESKVLTSVFYDFGKSLSNAFRSRDKSSTLEEHLAFSKSFLNVNLNAFLELFPNLQSDVVSNVRVHDMKPEAFLRLSARNGFKRGLKGKSQF